MGKQEYKNMLALNGLRQKAREFRADVERRARESEALDDEDDERERRSLKNEVAVLSYKYNGLRASNAPKEAVNEMHDRYMGAKKKLEVFMDKHLEARGPKDVQTGARGGRYYLSPSGEKVYVK